jgi:hypothetical protein
MASALVCVHKSHFLSFKWELPYQFNAKQKLDKTLVNGVSKFIDNTWK